MAQHDYVIANQGFPAFRSDLNDALAAIVSNNSGATEPATMFAHQMWVDTAADPSVLKIRNADNDAWITIGTINQTGDTFTLTSAVSATTLNTSGAVVFNDAGADVDFRVEGDTNQNLLFVDASADAVGIGTDSPGSFASNANNLVIGGGTGDEGLTIYSGNSSGDSGDIYFADGTTGNDLFAGYLIYQHDTDAMRFGTAATERMHIDASGNVGIGTTPSAWDTFTALDVNTFGTLFASTTSVQLSGNAYYASGDYKYKTSTGAALYTQNSSGIHTWFNAASGTAGNNITFTERMRIDASGNLLVGKTAVGYATAGIQILPDGRLEVTKDGDYTFIFRRNTNTGILGYFNYAGSDVGTISTNGSTTAYNTTSDYRLKENVAPMTGALAKVLELNPVTYTWKVDGSAGEGFIAHELQAVVPDAVTGEKDATEIKQVEVSPAVEATYDEEGNELTPAVEAVYEEREVPVYQGVDTSFLVATLTAAIQELKAELDAAKERIAALENA